MISTLITELQLRAVPRTSRTHSVDLRQHPRRLMVILGIALTQTQTYLVLSTHRSAG